MVIFLSGFLFYINILGSLGYLECSGIIIIHHSSFTTRLLDSFGAVSILVTLELNISEETRFRV